ILIHNTVQYKTATNKVCPIPTGVGGGVLFPTNPHGEGVSLIHSICIKLNGGSVLNVLASREGIFRVGGSEEHLLLSLDTFCNIHDVAGFFSIAHHDDPAVICIQRSYKS